MAKKSKRKGGGVGSRSFKRAGSMPKAIRSKIRAAGKSKRKKLSPRFKGRKG